jgi:uncharacterized protein Yka (UPF0111/DUF47 family)
MSFLKGFFETGEEKAFKNTKGIIRVARKANAVLADIINGDYDITKINKLEKEASSEYFKVSRSITTGAIAPNLIDDMIMIAGKEENIVDSVFKLARQLVRYRIRGSLANKYVREKLLEFNALSNTAIQLLETMHSSESISVMRLSRSRIKVIENQGDAVRDSLLDFAYRTKSNFKEFYHITDLAYIYDDVLDDCEDSSDIFLSIILSMIS